MATQKAKKPNYLTSVEQKLDQTIKAAGQLHNSTYTVSENLVDEAYRAGSAWNKILQKAVKGGVKICAKQQDLALDAIEGVVSQMGEGAEKFQKIIGFNIIKEVKSKTAEAKDAIENAIANVSDKIEHTMQDVEAKAKSTVKEAKKTVATAKKNLEEAASQIEDKATKANATKKKTATKVKATKAKVAKKVSTKKIVASNKKATAKKVSAKKTTTPKANKVSAPKLTAITGIGPKTMSILAEAGINTIADLSTSTKSKVDTILDGKGKIYATVNTQEWINEAKKMVK